MTGVLNAGTSPGTKTGISINNASIGGAIVNGGTITGLTAFLYQRDREITASEPPGPSVAGMGGALAAQAVDIQATSAV